MNKLCENKKLLFSFAGSAKNLSSMLTSIVFLEQTIDNYPVDEYLA